jgi:hypothetical protein
VYFDKSPVSWPRPGLRYRAQPTAANERPTSGKDSAKARRAAEQTSHTPPRRGRRDHVFSDRRQAASFERAGSWARGRSLPVLVVLTLLDLPLIGLAGVVAADLVPDRLVMNKLFEATERDALTIDNYPPGWSVRQVDRFSECKRITIGLGDPEGINPLASAIRSPTLGPCSSAVPKIVGWAQGEGLSRSYEYARYWNGSVSVFRPVIASWRVLASAVGRTAAWAGAAIIVGTTDFVDLPAALLHALAWVCLLGSVVILTRHSARWSLDVLVWVSFLVGAVFLFFADMANPEAAWTAAVGCVGLASIGLVSPGRLVLRMAATGAAWVAGFILGGWDAAEVVEDASVVEPVVGEPWLSGIIACVQSSVFTADLSLRRRRRRSNGSEPDVVSVGRRTMRPARRIPSAAAFPPPRNPACRLGRWLHCRRESHPARLGRRCATRG